MSKFNTQVTEEVLAGKAANHPDATVNHGVGLAYKMEAKRELYLLATTALIEDQYYQKQSEQLSRLRELVRQVDDQKFVLQLAHYTRRKMNLRSVATVLLAEASKLVSEYNKDGVSLLREYAPKILARADEPLELLAYWIDNIGNGAKSKFPNPLKRGVADIFRNLDEYALGKYWRGNSSKSSVKPKDLLRICHFHSDEGSKRKASKVFNDQIPVPQTWEAYISEHGSSAETWDQIAPEMGIMALVRNLRNFAKTGASGAMEYATQQMRDEEVIRNSKMLPFRWHAALKSLEGHHEIKVQQSLYQKAINAINDAMDISVQNIEGWKDRTAILVDTSGSMMQPVSRRSSIYCADIACILGAIAAKLSNEGEYLVGSFATNYKTVNLKASDSILTNAAKIKEVNVGNLTDAWKAFRYICDQKAEFDRIILLSDMQCYSSQPWDSHWCVVHPQIAFYWEKYKRTINQDAMLYSVDLTGYGTAVVPQDDKKVSLIGGWSERIFEYMNSTENVDSAITEIEKSW